MTANQNGWNAVNKELVIYDSNVGGYSLRHLSLLGGTSGGLGSVSGIRFVQSGLKTNLTPAKKTLIKY